MLDENSTLLIVGRGPFEKKLKKKAKNIKGVKFCGFVSAEDVPKYYSAADVFILPSTTETQGIVALESMACGCPVIGVDAMALSEVIEDRKNGCLFQAGNSKQLARIAREFTATKEMKQNCVKTAREYSKKKCVDKLEKLYESLV